MRILIVSHYFWPETFIVNDLAAALVARGHSVTVLTGMPNYPGGRYYPGYGPLRPATEERDGVIILRVPVIPRGLGRPWRLVANYASFVLSATLLGPLRCRGAFDTIFVITQGGPGDSTWVAAWYSYKITFSPPNNFGMGAASAFILALMVALIALVYMRAVYRRVSV